MGPDLYGRPRSSIFAAFVRYPIDRSITRPMPRFMAAYSSPIENHHGNDLEGCIEAPSFNTSGESVLLPELTI